MIQLRKGYDSFSGGELEIIPTENDHVLGFMRLHAGKHVSIFANFSEQPQIISARIVDQYSIIGKKLLHGLDVKPGRNGMTIAPLDFCVFG